MPDNELSIDELIVADLLLMGFSEAKISRKLKWSLKTVKTHCLCIYVKLGCKSRKELLNNRPVSLLRKEMINEDKKENQNNEQ